MKKLKFIRQNKWGTTYSLYECDCGKQFITRDSSVNSGNTKSCGCYHSKIAREGKFALKHGHKSNNKVSSTYHSWYNMKSRCTNPNYTNYKYWGGKGITMDLRWFNFEDFLKDMGVRPKGKSLDRINGTKGYYKDNCRWATRLEQNQNRPHKYIMSKPKGVTNGQC